MSSRIHVLAPLLSLACSLHLVAADNEDDPLPNHILPATNPEEGVRWGPLMNESLFFLGVEHAYRFAAEPFTRDRLDGKFFPDWGTSIANLHGWGDGDPFVINYVGHPMEGAVTGYLFVQNDPKYITAEFGRNRMYWKSRLRATAFAFASSELFEIGPLSEASLGNTQQYFPQQGLVDHVITPAVGMVWMIGEDWLDRTLIRSIEARTANPYFKLLLRGGLNPARSMANAMRLKVPWVRDTRPGVFATKGELLATSETSSALSLRPNTPDPPLNDLHSGPLPKFDFTTTYSYVQLAVGKEGSQACHGGGASATYNVNSWLGLMADVGGCKMYSPGVNTSGDSTTYLAGPRITFRNQTRWTPFVAFLLGGNKIATEKMLPELKPEHLGRVGVAESAVLHSKYTEENQTNGFAIQFGGGVDYELNRIVALHVLDVMNIHTWASELNGTHYPNNVRFSTGVALHFGNW
jgi:hypothetical protein